MVRVECFGQSTQSVLIMGFTILLVVVSQAAKSQQQQGAHTHGEADLSMVFDQGVIEVVFESPTMSLLGFEHAPATLQQQQRVDETKAFMNETSNVLKLDAEGCAIKMTNVSISGPAGQHFSEGKLETQAQIKPDDSGTDSHEHQHQHRPTHAKSGSHHHEQGHSEHSELLADYRYRCTNTSNPIQVVVTLFEQFPSLQKINVNWISETRQGAEILIPGAPSFELN